MDWLGLPKVPLLLGLVWMLGPTVMLIQALAGLLRRLRLLQNAVPVEAEVDKIEVAQAYAGAPESTIVDLHVSYRVDDEIYGRRLTRTDHLHNRYEIGDIVGLLHEENNPANAIDTQSHPWHDVIGPMVLSVLVFAFMAWLLLFLSGLR